MLAWLAARNREPFAMRLLGTGGPGSVAWRSVFAGLLTDTVGSHVKMARLSAPTKETMSLMEPTEAWRRLETMRRINHPGLPVSRAMNWMRASRPYETPR